MDFKKILSSFDAVENGTSEGSVEKQKQTGSMLAILESFNRAESGESIKEGGMKDAVTDMQERLHDFAREIQKGMHGYDSVVDELNDMFDEVVDMGDPIVMNAFKVLRTLEPEDFGEGEGGGPNRASMVAQDAMDMIDGSDDSDYDHLPKIGEGRMKDSVIHDSETMSKEEFAKKHGKEMADEYYESVDEAEVNEAAKTVVLGAEDRGITVSVDGMPKGWASEPKELAQLLGANDVDENTAIMHSSDVDFASEQGFDDDDGAHEFIDAALKMMGINESTVKQSAELEEAIMVSAEGDEAAQLLSILKLAGMPAPAPAMPAPMEPEMEPEMDMQDEYSNSPDEVEQDVDAVIASGDDLHREKDQYAASANGDNPMKAFEGKFKSILDEILAEDEK